MSMLKQSNKRLLSMVLSVCIVAAVFCGIGFTPAFANYRELGSSEAAIGASHVKLGVQGQGAIRAKSVGYSTNILGVSLGHSAYNIAVTSADVYVAPGEEITFTPEPDVEWRFVRWESNDSSLDLTDVDEINENYIIDGATYTAHFEQKTYSVHMATVTGGTISASDNSFKKGDQVTVTAIPESNYTFGGWSSSTTGVTFADPSATSTTFVMPGEDVNITASFIPVGTTTYTVATNVTPANGGSVTVENGTAFAAGATVRVRADAANDFEFSSWSANVAGVQFTKINDTTATFVMPASKITVTANFQAKAPEAQKYSITVIANEELGQGTIVANRVEAEAGEIITVTATPAANNQFFGFSARPNVPFDYTSDTSATFVMPASNIVVTADFVHDYYMGYYGVEVKTSGNGTITVEPDMFYFDDDGHGFKGYYRNFNANDKITVTATPDSGYRFSGWYLISLKPNEDSGSGPRVSTSRTYEFEVPDTQVYEHFMLIAEFEPTSSRGGSSGGSSSGGTSTSDQQRSASAGNLASAFGGQNVNVDGSVNQAAVIANIETAAATAGDTVTVRVVNASHITPETISAVAAKAAELGKPVILHADTLNSEGKVIGRMYLDCSQLTGLTGNYSTVVSPEDAVAVNTKTRFETWFDNSVEAVNIQQADLGARTHIAVKVDTANLNTEALALYSYDATANEYTAISNTEYAFDANGFLHFYTGVGGRIVIADGPFQVK